MLQLRSNLQDTRPFNLDDGKLKTNAHKIILFFFLMFQFLKVSPVDFGSVLFQLVVHSRTLTLQLRLRSKLKLSRRFDWKGVRTKNGKLDCKEVHSGPKKMSKKRVFRGFPENSKETFRRFTVLLQLRSNWQVTCPFERIRCSKNERGNFMQKNFVLGQKSQKMGFLGFLVTH